MKNARLPAIPVFAYYWLGVSLFFASIPLIFFLSPMIWAGFFGAVVWRCRAAIRGGERPGALVRILVILVGIGGVALIHRSLLGVAPGLEILLVLVTSKILEMRTHREFMLVTFLCLFLAATALFFQQAMSLTIYVLLACIAPFATAMRFSLGSRSVSWKAVFFPLGRMAVQALPLFFLLFLFFPRSRGGFVLGLTAPTSLMGMSDTLDPGDYANLSESDTLAFRADFPERNMPPLQELYWRGVVLWDCDGLHWRRGVRGDDTQDVPPSRGARVTQRITLEPHGRRWMFSLDHPVSLPRESRMMGGAFIEKAGELINKRPAPYYVESSLGNDATPMDPSILRRALQLPRGGLSARVLRVVDQWKSEGDDPEQVARSVMKFFRTEPFRYTMKPGTYSGAGALDEFLFNRRAGFCEHYAAAFSTLMRAAGIPSRVVGGYRGGRYNPVGDYIAVNQTDAHAWSEIWVKEKGWIRFDPADAIDPSRVSQEISERSWSNATMRRDSSLGGDGESWGWNAFGETSRLLWDNVNYKWDLWVVGYDQEAQFTFFSHLGFDENPWIRAGFIMICGTGATLGLLWAVMRWSRAPADPVLKGYRKVCTRFARAGFPRSPAEGPNAYAERLRTAFPHLGGAIGEVFGAYAVIRYGPNGFGQVHRFLAACRRLKP